MGTLPIFRDDIQLSVHTSGDDRYLILVDPFGYAESSIMLGIDVLEVLDKCDGRTTYQDLAAVANVAVDGVEIANVRAFVDQLDSMGFMEGAVFNDRRAKVDAAWDALASKPMTCAGPSYPADAEEFMSFIQQIRNVEPSPEFEAVEVRPSSVVLMPHIDMGNVPEAYTRGVAHIAAANPDVVVLIGTSHYWNDDPIVLTNKSFDTPLGTLNTHEAIVDELRQRLGNLCSDTDVAHKPEHSLEYHAVLVHAMHPENSPRIVPILVADIDGLAEGEVDRIADIIGSVVREHSSNPLWLISGDMSHVGPKFGNEELGRVLLGKVQTTDATLLDEISCGNVSSWYHTLHENNETQICGYAPVTIALKATQTTSGILEDYGVWDDDETESVVTYATMGFFG